MDIAKILTQLRHEHERIEEAILSLERLVHGGGHRRGRPPAWLKAVGTKTMTKRQGSPSGKSQGAIAGPAADNV